MCKLFLVLALLGCAAGTFVLLTLTQDALRDLPVWGKQNFVVMPSSTSIYDGKGQLITKLRGTTFRIPVKIDQISPFVQDAIVAVEDQRFYDHKGIDYWGLTRALFNDLRGRSQEGASTITQQLVKNVLLSPERSLSRKIREAVLARQVETVYSKREILELYLNYSYFGEGAQGIEAASRTYFNKSAAELTLPESALLAGITKNPTRFSPFINPKEANNRRDTVLQVMLRNGYITVAQYQAAAAAPLPRQRQSREDNYPYPYYLDHVIDELIKRYGFSESQIYDGGLQVYTTLDTKVQQVMEEVYADKGNFPSSSDDRLPESAMVVVEQSTGSVKGLVGGLKHVSRRGYNRATMLKRQPGSTFKPLVVYAPAIEKGYGPATLLDSSVEAFGSNADAYAPENMGSADWGKISMRRAIVNSVNTYAVKLLKIIGVNEGYTFGKRLGLTSLNSQDKVLGLALGGTTEGVSPLELASAYAPLANRGVKLETHAISKVVDSTGKVLLEVKPKPQTVMKQETADMLTDLLKSAVDSGTGHLAKIDSRGVAGKTGTTQLPQLPEFKGIKQGNKDAWFAGYTPELVGVVWLGYDITDSKHYLNKVTGGSYPATIWNRVFVRILADAPQSQFAPPPASMASAEKRLWVNKPKTKTPSLASSRVTSGKFQSPQLVQEPPATQSEPKADSLAKGSKPKEVNSSPSKESPVEDTVKSKNMPKLLNKFLSLLHKTSTQ